MNSWYTFIPLLFSTWTIFVYLFFLFSISLLCIWWANCVGQEKTRLKINQASWKQRQTRLKKTFSMKKNHHYRTFTLLRTLPICKLKSISDFMGKSNYTNFTWKLTKFSEIWCLQIHSKWRERFSLGNFSV